jgi:hypothetical protein
MWGSRGGPPSPWPDCFPTTAGSVTRLLEKDIGHKACVGGGNRNAGARERVLAGGRGSQSRRPHLSESFGQILPHSRSIVDLDPVIAAFEVTRALVESAAMPSIRVVPP